MDPSSPSLEAGPGALSCQVQQEASPARVGSDLLEEVPKPGNLGTQPSEFQFATVTFGLGVGNLELEFNPDKPVSAPSQVRVVPAIRFGDVEAELGR